VLLRCSFLGVEVAVVVEAETNQQEVVEGGQRRFVQDVDPLTLVACRWAHRGCVVGRANYVQNQGEGLSCTSIQHEEGTAVSRLEMAAKHNLEIPHMGVVEGLVAGMVLVAYVVVVIAYMELAALVRE
jgi:hypothetical protein